MRISDWGSYVCSSDLIQGFFDIPTDNLYAAPVMSADIQARFAGKNLMVVSPDVGGVVRARARQAPRQRPARERRQAPRTKTETAPWRESRCEIGWISRGGGSIKEKKHTKHIQT